MQEIEQVTPKDEKQIRAEIKQAHTEAVFAIIPKVGLIALGGVDFDDYIAYSNAINSPSDSPTEAKIQLIFDGLIYPTEATKLAQLRRYLRAKQGKVSLLQDAVELLSKGPFPVTELQLTEEKRSELEAKYEFGFDGIRVGDTNVIIAVKDEASPLVRVVLDESQRERREIGSKVYAAIMASIVEPEHDAADVLLQKHPGLISNLTTKLFELIDDGSVVLAKN